MTDFTTLKEMGISAFELISRFSLRREHDRDVLKIHYLRPVTSLRRHSQKFTFARPRISIPGQSRHSQAWRQLTDCSPMLQQALAELKQLTGTNEQPLSAKQEWLQDLHHLENVVEARLVEIRENIEQLNRVDLKH
ncbi:DUF3461 family protein [Pseudomonas violetae]|jgi:hypothetical protein|uniref:DUF3461 family protein n=1 Tax=Pseudomonas violetae TaxID=2915813 RepID=A0ABT0F205_9PSED|nr:DUF3461 family protein [Pseudomonas violetae]MCK1792028.1 DUF3461 family protein [Pseudomonas violetae]